MESPSTLILIQLLEPTVTVIGEVAQTQEDPLEDFVHSWGLASSPGLHKNNSQFLETLQKLSIELFLIPQLNWFGS